MNSVLRILAALVLIFPITATCTPDAPASPGAPLPPVNFSRDILPVLSDHCYQCHGPDEKGRKGDLRLDLEDWAKRKNKDGETAVVPANPEASTLLQRITATDPDDLMPPRKANKPLTPEQIALLKRWIAEGAKWGRHWAFEQLAKPTLPAGADQPIDAFVRDRLQREGLTPSPEARRETLIRRVSLDLTGLPPTPEEVAAFLRDPSPRAYESLVDRLLASPHFGERMAWDWLDAARYADTNGYQGDQERTMWPWRDWVIRAFNANLPFDQFTVWQLAGDLLPEATKEQKLATAFCRNHMINGEGGRIAEENRVDYVMDMTETMGTVWLGLTLNCCRCHDHKFDPLSNRDYYSLFAFFDQTPVNGGGGNPKTPPVLDLPTEEEQARVTKAEAELQAVEAKLKALSASIELKKDDPTAATEPKEVKDLRAQHEAKKKSLQDARGAVTRVMVMEDMKTPRETFMLDKGLYDKPKDKVTAALPVSLGKLHEDQPKNRLALANWLVSAENPLTARVIVNRFWQQFFGIGLVKTPEDFGMQGERPVQAELIDWLAADFREHGWDVKRLCKQIVMSTTYRQESKVSATMAERDPQNRLLARGPRFRMSSWMLRDQALAASGLLAPKIGGPSVKPYQAEGIWEEATFGKMKYDQGHGDALYRRSLYTFWRRITGPPTFFDNASRQVCTVKVFRTNTPLHSLITLNETTFVEAARALAQQVLGNHQESDDVRIANAFRRVLARPPGPGEMEIFQKALQRYRAQFASDPKATTELLAVGESKRDETIPPVEHAAFTLLCSTIFNLDETLTKE